MGPIKIHNGGNEAHAQDSDAYNFSFSKNSANFIRNVYCTVKKI